jgi:Clathrin light chain
LRFFLTVSLAQTELRDATGEPSADDFLAREKAILGDDANQFATSDDAAAFPDDNDLLGGTGPVASTSFESQFPDISSANEVCSLVKRLDW